MDFRTLVVMLAVLVGGPAPGLAASVITSTTAPTTDILLSQTGSGGIAQVESQQDPSPANDAVGQSFTPTAPGWQLESITLRNSNSNLWGADDSILVVVIDDVATWLTQSWGQYSDVLALPSSVGDVDILAREEFELAPMIQPQYATFELGSPLALTAGTQYGFLLYLDTDDGFTWLPTSSAIHQDPLPGESLLYSNASVGNASVSYDLLFYLQGTASVPEPGRLWLLAPALAWLLRRRRTSPATA